MQSFGQKNTRIGPQILYTLWFPESRIPAKKWHNISISSTGQISELQQIEKQKQISPRTKLWTRRFQQKRFEKKPPKYVWSICRWSTQSIRIDIAIFRNIHFVCRATIDLIFNVWQKQQKEQQMEHITSHIHMFIKLHNISLKTPTI